MKLTGNDIKNIRSFLKMHAKDFAKKAGLKGERAQGSVYRWERDLLNPSATTVSNIRKLFFSSKLVSAMQIVAYAMAEIKDIPKKIDLTFYADEEAYRYFHGDDASPFWLFQETNREVVELIKKLGIAVSLLEITKPLYEKWLQNQELEDSPQNRTAFVGHS